MPILTTDGADAGFRTVVAVFPDLKMGFLAFSNQGEANPGSKAMAMADLFLKDTAATGPKTSPVTPDSSRAYLKHPSSFKKFLGDYVSEEEGRRVQLRMQDNKLYWNDGKSADLVMLMHDTLSLFGHPEVRIMFSTPRRGDTVAIVAFSTPEKQVYKKYIALPQTDAVLTTFTGIYYCPELECKYGIVLKDHRLVMTNIKYNDLPLTFQGTDHLFPGFWAINHIRMLRDAGGRIMGFEVNSGRIEHLRFNKL